MSVFLVRVLSLCSLVHSFHSIHFLPSTLCFPLLSPLYCPFFTSYHSLFVFSPYLAFSFLFILLLFPSSSLFLFLHLLPLPILSLSMFFFSPCCATSVRSFIVHLSLCSLSSFTRSLIRSLLLLFPSPSSHSSVSALLPVAILLAVFSSVPFSAILSCSSFFLDSYQCLFFLTTSSPSK